MLSALASWFQHQLSWADFYLFLHTRPDQTYGVTMIKRVLFPRDKARTSFHSREVAIVSSQNALNNADGDQPPAHGKYLFIAFLPTKTLS